MKRLLCLISNMNAGGAETFLMKLYRNLNRQEYQMDFCINVFEHCFYEDEILSLGGKIFRIPARTKHFFQHNKQLTDIVRNYHYERVLVVSSNATCFLDLKICQQSGVKIRAVRSSNSKCSDSMIGKIVHNYGVKHWSKYANLKIAPSDLAALFLFGKDAVDKNDVLFLRNALDLNTYCFKPEGREKIRRELNIGKDTVVFGHVGRFYEQKNHDFLVEIFSEIVKRQKNSVLLLVGSGALEEDIRKKVDMLRIKDKVFFVGTRKDIPDLLSAMDVFVFPSFFEGMPNTVIEAQSTGLNCIISDTITREANITGNVIYLSLNETKEKWAEMALDLLAKPRMNIKNDLIENGYDITTCARIFEKAIFK